MRRALWPLAVRPQLDKSNNVLEIYANSLLDTVTL